MLGSSAGQGSPSPLGYNPYLNTGYTPPPVVTPSTPANVPPSGPSYIPSYANPYAGYQGGAGGYLRGAADLTAATGQYWQDIQQARITREQSRQAAIDTERKRVQWELEYEQYRPTAPKMMAQEKATDIDYARRFATPTDIWSGKVLNVLYQSVLTSPRPLDGPTIPVDGNVLRGINLNTKTTRGSLGLLKDGGKLDWPGTLQDAPYDEPRNSFTKHFDVVARGLESGSGAPSRAQIKQLNEDLLSLSGLLDGQVKDLSPSDYIGSRRFLNQLKDTLKALSDPGLVRNSATRLPPTIRSIPELVGYLRNNGLAFAPAIATGDEPAYTTLYSALRAYEGAVAYAGR
jgi:hypothetical protein